MTKVYEIFVLDGITIIKFLDVPCFEQIVSGIDEMLAHFPVEKKLWDFSEVQFSLPTEDLKQLAIYGKKVFREPHKSAYYNGNDLSYGQLRQFEAYRSSDKRIETGVFRSLDDAIEWLNTK